MSQLDKRVALITAAKGGLGTRVTESFLNAGATVLGVSRSIRQSDFDHPAFHAVPAELTSGEAARQLADEVAAKFGRIDILVHVMGGFAGGRPVADTDDATLEHMLDLNLRSAFYITRALIPHMRKQGYGRIVAVGSRAAVEPQALVGAYSASKAALVSLVRTLAIENKDAGITANVVLPGTMDTPGNRTADPGADFSKWIPPARVSSLMLWLAAEAASHVSGAVIPVYGHGV
jgi:NAD(P)-dependent dehydrogenase (short-subunit alcohol dehydrogenase family)